MKTIILPIRQLAIAGAALLLLVVTPNTAPAQGKLSFSASGNSITITNSAPLAFVLPAGGSNGYGFGFNIENAYSTNNTSDFGTPNSSGTMTLTLNGTTYAANGNYTGSYGTFTQGEFDPNDFLFGFSTGGIVNFNAGNVITLSAGTFTYTGGTSVPRLPDFTTATMTLVDGSVQSLGASVVVTNVVPEPSTRALFGVGAGLLGLALRRRRAGDV